MATRRGKPDEELFLQGPSNGEDSPTIEPLRFTKPMSPNPRADSAASGRYNYPPPSSKQNFPLPPGASSSASPLPYPDDEDSYQYTRPAESRTHRAPYPDDRRITPERTGSGDSNDQRRPSANSRNGSTDSAPGYNTSSVDKRGTGPAERRGTAPEPLPESPDLTEKEGLFAKAPRREKKLATAERRPTQPGAAQYPDYKTLYKPPPIPGMGEPDGGSAGNANLIAPTPSGMHRFSSTASTSTTRATRGSPPPPETPILGPGEAGGGIEARYAAAGIAGTATLSSLQAHNAAAAQRANQYGPPPVPQMPLSPAFAPAQTPVPRPWTPTESPETQPHGPPTVYQGPNQVSPSTTPQTQQPSGKQGTGSQPNALEQDFQRMQMSASPPPAYSSVTPGGNGAGNAQGYSNEKRSGAPAPVNTATKLNIASPLTSPALQHPGHPAFANDSRDESAHQQQAAQTGPVQQFANASPFQGAGPASPPPLPEGWIAHLDQNSGQYYYIHLPTQATQWEFPTGPMPLNHDPTPLSPSGSSTYGNPLASPGMSTFGKTPLGSPLFPPHTPGYAESIMSMTSQTLLLQASLGHPQVLV